MKKFKVHGQIMTRNRGEKTRSSLVNKKARSGAPEGVKCVISSPISEILAVWYSVYLLSRTITNSIITPRVTSQTSIL